MSIDNRCTCDAQRAEDKHRPSCLLFLFEVDEALRRPVNGKLLREDVERLRGSGDVRHRLREVGSEWHEGWGDALDAVLDLLDAQEGVTP